MKRLVRLLLAILVVTLIVTIPVFVSRREEPLVRARLVAEADELTGYLRAEGPVPLEFPADHGPHPDYQTEWWYYTGNLQTGGGRHFGYQLTFFRRALVPPALRQERSSAWAADQVYMAHLALTDVTDRHYQAFERFSRGAAGLAGAQAAPYRVWLDDWSVEEVRPGVMRMRATQGEAALDLMLTDQKGPILHGDQGYSQKGPQPGDASIYYSLPRLATSGTVQVGNTTYPVTGLSWMDHEFSTSALGTDQVGWDWFALQLDSGSELMVFQLRQGDGRFDPYSSGTFIGPDGSTQHLSRDDFQIRAEGTWRSPRTGAVYPARWTILVPGVDLTLHLEPYLADQELDLSIPYWEGAVHLEGEQAGQQVQGSGYVELTGYAGSMQGHF